MSARRIRCSAEQYDASINWAARFKREMPVLKKLFGPPGEYPLLDAACGTGRHAVALARQGYHLVAADKDPGMIAVARTIPGADSPAIQWRSVSFARLSRCCPGPFAGIYCIGNSLSAAGSAAAVQKALRSFAAVLHPRGRLFIQVLNYPPMRRTVPCVLGPVHFQADGVEYLRLRLFDFARSHASVTHLTLTRGDKWTCRTGRGRLFVFTPNQLQRWCRRAGLRVEKLWGSYAGERLNPRKSTDLIVIGRRARGRTTS